jgi:hypothetical protein
VGIDIPGNPGSAQSDDCDEFYHCSLKLHTAGDRGNHGLLGCQVGSIGGPDGCGGSTRTLASDCGPQQTNLRAAVLAPRGPPELARESRSACMPIGKQAGEERTAK